MATKPKNAPAQGESENPGAGLETGQEMVGILNRDQDTKEFGAPPAVYTESAMATNKVRAPNGMELTVRRRISMPSLTFLEGMTIVVRVMDGIVQGKLVREVKPGKAAMEPGFCCTVSSLSGEHRTLWTGAVLKKELEESYQNDSYVGQWFHIQRLPMKRSSNGFMYSPFVINEIEPPTESAMIQSAKLTQREAIESAQARQAAEAAA